MTRVKAFVRHPYFWLFWLIALAYWPITFQQLVIPHDMVNCWIPWRHYISDTIQQGQFPWWNPYQQMGYPIHADLQGPSWHLESLLASMVGRQGPIYIQYAFLGYIFIGAIGIHKLSSLFTQKQWIQFVIGAAYACSGFFTNHSMHLFSIISGAFVPHIIYHFIRLFQTHKSIHALITAVFVFFNLTGGNQTFTIITFYLLLPVFIHFALKLRNEDKKISKKFLLNCGLLGGAILAMGSVIFVVFTQFKPYLGRLSHLKYEMATQFPFTPEASLSLINPMSGINATDWTGTDGTMANAYFGVIFFLFWIFAFSRSKTTLEKILLGFGLFTLIASFGNNTFVYECLFKYVPLHNKFRFPAYYTYFFMLTALLLSAKTLELFIEEKKWQQYRYGFWVLIALSAGMIIYGAVTFKGPAFFNAGVPWYNTFTKTSLSQNLLFYGVFQMILLLVFSVAFKRAQLKLIVTLLLVEVVVSMQPNLLALAAGGVKPWQVETSLATYNKEGLPRMNPVKDNVFYNHAILYLWQNVNYLDKQIGYDGFNSNYFSSLESMAHDYYAYSQIIWQNSYVYYSDSILTKGVFLSDTARQIFQNTTLIEDKDAEAFKQVQAVNDSVSHVIPTQFKNADMRFFSKAHNTFSLNLLQSYYPGWKAYIDGEPTTIYKTNGMFMSVIVPPGERDVVFIYDNQPAKIAAVISYASFLLVMMIISVYYVREKRRNLLFVLPPWIITTLIVVNYFLF